jgi:AraC family transcriptional regulator
MKWAGPRGLFGRPDVKMLSVYHDDPEVTEESKLRVDVCLTVPPETQVGGEVGKTTIPGGKYALALFTIDADQYQKAWDFVFCRWLPESGYQPDDRPCFEWYLNNPQEHPEKKHIMKICLPVRPL